VTAIGQREVGGQRHLVLRRGHVPAGGKRKQTRRRGFPTRKAAQASLTELLGSLATETYVAPKRQTLAGFLEQTWLPAIKHTIRPSTHESYARNVRLHLAGRPIGKRQLQRLDGAALSALYAELLAGDDQHRPLSSRSVYYVHTIVHRALKDAVKWRAVVRNVADDADPPEQSSPPEMRTWRPAEVRAFLAGTADDRLHAAFVVLLSTGMRWGELLGLRWSDVDLDAGELSIRRTLITVDVQRKGDPGYAWSEPKTKKGRRTIALDSGCVRALREHRRRQAAERLAFGPGYTDDDLVICQADGRPIHPKTFSYYWDRAVRRLGMPRLTVHGARHTWATLALQAGISPRVVQERIGHAHVSITLGTYSHVDLAMQADAAARVAALVEGDESR
jgi:integrase